MHKISIKRGIALAVLLAIVAFASASGTSAQASAHDNSPDLPSPLCDAVQVPPGNRVIRHTYAQGVQIYRWNGASWGFVEPVATLFADADFHSKVGTHYLGPTWESNSGSKVVATRLTGCTPDPTAIPWLLLQTVTTDGPGPFNSVTYIQRVNTKGGLVPTAPGSSIGSVAEVPYSAEYYFYRARN
jgi:hypothetical protein